MTVDPTPEPPIDESSTVVDPSREVRDEIIQSRFGGDVDAYHDELVASTDRMIEMINARRPAR